MYIVTSVLNNKIVYQSLSIDEDQANREYLRLVNDIKAEENNITMDEQTRYFEFIESIDNEDVGGGTVEIIKKPIHL
jgi:hypothetical protein